MPVTYPFSPLLEQAAELAAQWHDETYRKSCWRGAPFEVPHALPPRVPVVAHVTTVALTVQRAGWDDVVVAAAFVHDVLEDANRYGARFRREQMTALLGPAVTHLVEVVTEPKHDADGRPLPWRLRKETYLAQVQAGPDGALAISLADKLHNLWTINEGLAAGLDVFASVPGRRGLSAGPAEQAWFHENVLAAAAGRSDARLRPLQERLREELDRFRTAAS